MYSKGYKVILLILHFKFISRYLVEITNILQKYSTSIITPIYFIDNAIKEGNQMYWYSNCNMENDQVESDKNLCERSYHVWGYYSYRFVTFFVY